MTFKPLFGILGFLMLSCTQQEKLDEKNYTVDTEMATIKQDYRISWKDSAKVKFGYSNTLSGYPDIEYDSAKILFYWGYNLEDTASYFPVDSNGRWISTIIQSLTVSKTDLSKVDSLLGKESSYDNSTAAGGQCPKYGIVYFKNGKVMGQTSIGPGSQTVRTTFKLPKLCYSQRLDNPEFKQIEVELYRKLHIYGL